MRLRGRRIVEEAFLRATWARAQAPGANTSLFKIEKVAEGVYAALARPQVLTNCNAASRNHSPIPLFWMPYNI